MESDKRCFSTVLHETLKQITPSVWLLLITGKLNYKNPSHTPYEYGALSPIPSYNHQKEQTNTQPNGYYIHSGAMNSGLHPLHLLVSIWFLLIHLMAYCGKE